MADFTICQPLRARIAPDCPKFFGGKFPQLLYQSLFTFFLHFSFFSLPGGHPPHHALLCVSLTPPTSTVALSRTGTPHQFPQRQHFVSRQGYHLVKHHRLPTHNLLKFFLPLLYQIKTRCTHYGLYLLPMVDPFVTFHCTPMVRIVNFVIVASEKGKFDMPHSQPKLNTINGPASWASPSFPPRSGHSALPMAFTS